jgi:hypothetical protein
MNLLIQTVRGQVLLALMYTISTSDFMMVVLKLQKIYVVGDQTLLMRKP